AGLGRGAERPRRSAGRAGPLCAGRRTLRARAGAPAGFRRGAAQSRGGETTRTLIRSRALNTRFLSVGLFFATLATLLLETLDARLLSVLTWYHLSFFAVSLAMLGMAGGAVFVFLHPERFSGDRAPRALARTTFAFALAIPISHL